ncbi:hypothetical protein B4U79_16836, partial [Dinothrombium tinctorium]
LEETSDPPSLTPQNVTHQRHSTPINSEDQEKENLDLDWDMSFPYAQDPNRQDTMQNNVETAINSRPIYQIGNYFNGFESEDVEEYLIRFERIADCNSWTQEQRKQHLPAYLRNAAESWHHSYHLLNPDCTWDELKDTLKAAFPSSQQLVLQRSLLTHTQGPNDSIPSYFHFMRYLCDRVDPNMPEQKRKDYIIRGLRQPYLCMVLAANPADCEELWVVLQRIRQAEIISDMRPSNNITEPNNCPILTNLVRPQTGPQASVATNNQPFRTPMILQRDPMERVMNRLCNRLERMEMALRRNPNVERARPEGNPRMTRTEDGRVICFRCNQPEKESGKLTKATLEGRIANVFQIPQSFYKMLTIVGAVNNVYTYLIIDTGAVVSIITEEFAKEVGEIIYRPDTFEISLMSNQTIKIDKLLYATVSYDGTHTEVRFLVVKEFAFPALLGLDWCRRAEVNINFGKCFEVTPGLDWIPIPKRNPQVICRLPETLASVHVTSNAGRRKQYNLKITGTTSELNYDLVHPEDRNDFITITIDNPTQRNLDIETNISAYDEYDDFESVDNPVMVIPSLRTDPDVDLKAVLFEIYLKPLTKHLRELI